MIAAKVNASTGEEGPRTHSKRARRSSPGTGQGKTTWPPKGMAPLPPAPRRHKPKTSKKGKGWEKVEQDELFDRMRNRIRGER